MAALKTLWKRIGLRGECVEDEKLKKDRKMHEKEDIFRGFLNPIESYVVSLQSILIWENPVQSAIAFSICNILFWWIVYCQYRFYFVTAIVAAATYVYCTWTRHIWPEIRVPIPEGEDTEEWTPVNPQVFSVPEISRYLTTVSEDFKHWINWLINLRQDHKGKFCTVISCCLIILGCIGRCFSGVFIAYVLMCLIIMGPGFVVHIYPHIRNAVTNCDLFPGRHEVYPIKVQDDPVDELVTESNQELMNFLASALERNLTHEQEIELTESKDSDFSPSLDLMPSHERDSDSDTDTEERVPIIKTAATIESQPESIKFISSHYEDLDSDDAEENRLAEGLYFEEDDVDSRLSFPHEASPDRQSTSSGKSERSMGTPATSPPHSEAKKHTSSRRLSQQSDIELSDYELISESELS